MIRDVLGHEATDRILNEVEPLLQQLQTLGWKEIRPWGEFFATFKAPQFAAKNLEQRVTTNALYYRSNYLAVCCGVLILQVLFAPMILVSSIMIAGLYAYLIHVHKGAFRVGDIVFDRRGKSYLFLGLSLVIMFVSGTVYKVLWALIYSILLCGAHMIFRPRNVQSKANRAYEEMKLSGGDIFSFIPNSLYQDSKTADSPTMVNRYPSAAVDPEDPGESYDSKDNYGGSVRKRGGPSYSYKDDR